MVKDSQVSTKVLIRKNNKQNQYKMQIHLNLMMMIFKKLLWDLLFRKMLHLVLLGISILRLMFKLWAKTNLLTGLDKLINHFLLIRLSNRFNSNLHKIN